MKKMVNCGRSTVLWNLFNFKLYWNSDDRDNIRQVDENWLWYENDWDKLLTDH